MTNQSRNKSFILHLDSLIILDKLSDEQAGKFFKSLYHFKKTGEKLNNEFAIDLALTPFFNQFIRDDEKYKITCERRKESGSMGGKQKVANLADNKNDNENNNNFEQFWNFYTPIVAKDGNYVSKGNKFNAKKSYEKAIKEGFTHEKIMQSLEFYLNECKKNSSFTKHAVSWLNQSLKDGFENEIGIVIGGDYSQKLSKQDLINKDLEQFYK